MNKITIIILALTLSNCTSETPSVFEEEFDRGEIIGVAADEFFKFPLSGVIVTLGDISDTTSGNGEFHFERLKEGSYTLNFSTTGYSNLQSNLKASRYNDYLSIPVIEMKRNKYQWKEIEFDALPDLYDSLIYSNYYAFRHRTKHTATEGEWDEQFVNRELDSIIIQLLRNAIPIDSAWYQSYIPSCGSTQASYGPIIAFKLSQQNPKMDSLGFIINPVMQWNNCTDEVLFRLYDEF